MHFEELPLFAPKPQTQPQQAAKVPKPSYWTVGELTARIKEVLEPAFFQIWVQGEISNYRPGPSTHAYFSLKDEKSCISAAIFGWGARKKNFELKDGLQVLCRGKVAVYSPRGQYQFVIDQVEPLGAGALQVAFEQLKAKLAAEGLFDTARKRAIPKFPTKIAVITSPTGAAIYDMLNVLRRLAPQIQVLVVPALVQGDGAAPQLIRGLEWVNQHRLADLIVLARGGGSIEDLWCFNNEDLARAITKSILPVVSAVGHEVDFTISDFVADLRAPTPSAAAEMISSHWLKASTQVREFSVRLKNFIAKDLSSRKMILSHLAARVISPRDRLREQMQKTDEVGFRIFQAIRVLLDRRKALLGHGVAKMDALSPLRVLERGYTLVRDPYLNGLVVKSAQQIQSGQELEIIFHDGQKRVQAI